MSGDKPLINAAAMKRAGDERRTGIVGCSGFLAKRNRERKREREREEEKESYIIRDHCWASPCTVQERAIAELAKRTSPRPRFVIQQNGINI